MSQNLNSTVAVIGIDIGKNSFHVVGQVIGMECVGAHHLSRKLKTLGHDARLMPAKYGAPVLQGTEERLPRCGGDRRVS